jgi:predicted AlkP superfamily pyrophosphatase or phosphodiesterase
MRRRTSFVFLTLLFALLAAAQRPPTTRPIPAIRRVLIVSIDGLRPDVLLRADAPNLHGLYRSGAYSFWARTTEASITLPSHVSMLTGVAPEVHGVSWNEDLPPEATQRYPKVPTILELARRAGYTTAVAAGKSKFAVLDSPGALDWKWFSVAAKTADADVLAGATSILRAHQPEVFFIHFADVDTVGHASGWGSDEQLNAIKAVDGCVGQLLATIRELKLDDQTLIIVSADHGGAGRKHGPNDVRSRTIPWIIAGPGVRKNFDLTLLGRDRNVQTFDTFATAAAVLGIPVPGNIAGKFVNQAFEGLELVGPATQQARKD